MDGHTSKIENDKNYVHSIHLFTTILKFIGQHTFLGQLGQTKIVFNNLGKNLILCITLSLGKIPKNECGNLL